MFDEEMEATTYLYDYESEPTRGSGLCESEKENMLGAKLSVLFYFMFFFSLMGNGLVLFIIQRFEKLTTVTNILLLNLVVSSLIFISTLPFMGAYMQLQRWIFGRAMCKIVGCFHYLGIYSSVLLLALLTFDRHLAVVYSLNTSRLRSRSYVLISCTVVWLVSGLACTRSMLIVKTFTFQDVRLCEEFPGDLENVDVKMLKEVGFYLQLFLFLIFPLVVIIYCYLRIVITVIMSKIASKFKTVRLIFVIVLIFFICWAPFNIVTLMSRNKNTMSCDEKKQVAYAVHITRNMAYVYFSISPLFYTFVGRKFQNYFRQLVVKRFSVVGRFVSVPVSVRNQMSSRSTPPSNS